MVGEKCECCGDEVLIIRIFEGKRLCLDCFENQKMKNDVHMHSMPASSYEKISYDYVKASSSQGKRFCTNCGRPIPFDSIICPYCFKRFETFF
ncbi:MAG: hypothetical protein R6V50_00165 [Thermoplasmatota archaeon]